MSAGASFTPGPSFDALPLPGLMLDAQDRIVGLNDAAEIWLNLSRRLALGHRLEDEQIHARLQVSPALSPLLDRVRDGHGPVGQPRLRFDLGDRTGGHLPRFGDIHLGPAPDELPGGVILLIAPTEAAAGLSPGDASRKAARQAVGMAEMLAHEIKNPLSGIRGAAQLLSMNVGEQDREFTDLIVEESRRIVALLDQVERFGDTSPPDLRPVNLHDVLERARRSAELGFARDLHVVTEYDPSLPDALGDDDKLMQVALNLLKNAAEALHGGQAQGRDGRCIRIRTLYDGALRLSPCPDHPNGRALPLQIEIEDDGPGIPDAIAGQIFEPFVSGRENGTGLGLSLVSKIVADHGGWLRVESRPGRTVFRISLPKA
ncbi:two-component system, NtrC family, nitrogen regulation sensor histidine kinase GlnL [Paracoccus isoporae]|uniref:histidine kinase n=1 Tax=Paracoccus isoporae TaxID=591205 RepID=A0A1G7E447_9RHOB|nr:ATP-binding protein [Paracoccus isoporae]SDE58463.1 two-component system, NtrC family, nitrogen regulation sensor histidine kinase GlnL [Paracoccus isoporae]